MYKESLLFKYAICNFKLGFVECLDGHYAVTHCKFATPTPAGVGVFKLQFIGEFDWYIVGADAYIRPLDLDDI